jgi:hypothetical protein
MSAHLGDAGGKWDLFERSEVSALRASKAQLDSKKDSVEKDSLVAKIVQAPES